MVRLRWLTVLVILICSVSKCIGRSANQNARGDVNTFYTTRDYEFTKWLQMLMRSDVIFQVKACSDVHILLTYEKGNRVEASTEIVLGGWYNSRSAMRNGTDKDSEPYKVVSTEGVLHCSEYRMFHISWRHERLRIGRGPNPGEQTIMDLDRRESGGYWHRIRYVGFSTGYGFSGAWKIEENQGYHFYLNAPDDYSYSYLWKSVTQKGFHFLRFRVKACHDVHVSLAPEIGQQHYEVVLGGWDNTKSVLRIGYDHKDEYLENDITDCDVHRFFWISWYNGYISVGKGEMLEQNGILRWFDPGFVNINHASFCAGYGSTAEFVFEEDLENRFALLSTPSDTTDPKYDMFIETPRQQYITFQLRACSDAYIGLSMSPGGVDEFTQHIYLGGKSNTVSGVKRGDSSSPSVEVATPDLLSCTETREFWMYWRDGRVQLGSGWEWGDNAFLAFDLPEYFKRINSVGLANTIGEQALWAVRRDDGDNIFLRTQPLLDFTHLWITTFLDYYTSFKVRCCRDAHILLTSADGVTSQEVFEIILGYNGYKTVMRQSISGENFVAEADTPDVIDCREFRTFWVGWTNGYLSIGRGHKYGERELLNSGTPLPMRINALSIASDGLRGSWQFESDRGDYVEFMTTEAAVTQKWVHVYPWNDWIFFAVSGSAAGVLMSTRYRDASRSYSLYIGTESNTKVSLFKDQSLVASAAIPNVMDPLDLRDFYVSWEGGMFQFGLGKYRDTEVLLEYTDTDPYDVEGIAFMSPEAGVTEWRVWEYYVSEASYDSSVYASFTQFWLSVRHRTHMKFALQTCGRAEVLLSAAMYTQHDDYTHTVIMDDTSAIWEGNKKQKYVEKATPGLLSCSEERYYWLSWFEGHLVLGSGSEHGQNILISHHDLNALDVRAVSVATSDEKGTWRVPFSSYADYQDVPPSAVLSGGEIAGIVVGGLLLIVVFVFAVGFVMNPPERFKPYVTGEGAPSGGDSRQQELPATSFVNPLTEVSMTEVSQST